MLVTPDPAPRALRKLLLSLFTASDLQRLIGDYYDEILNSLPVGGSSEDLAASVVDALARFGYIDARLFARILAERPHQSEAVRLCAAVWGLDLEDAPPEQPATRALRSGTLLGRYKLIERIGHGGFGSVWTCEAPGGEVVAVKILRPDYGSEPRLVARFFHGAARMTGFSDPMFVRLLEPRCEEQGIFFYVMAHVDGPCLDEAVRKHGLVGTRVLPQMIELGRALGRAHRSGRIHRDVKPGNIIVDRQGRLYLTDFDFVGLLDGPLHTLTTTVASHNYAAPEVVRGEPADVRAEVYSFARTVLFLLHGETSASGSYPPLESVLARSCAHEPHARYPDMDSLCDAMTTALEAHRACPPWPDLKIDMTMRIAYRAAGSYEDRELPLRILLLGEFSPGTSGALDAQRTVRINRDNLDQALKAADMRLTTRVASKSPIDVELRIRSMSDFHPDALIQQIPALAELQLRRDALKIFKDSLGNRPEVARHLLAYTRAADSGPDQDPPPETLARLFDAAKMDPSCESHREALSSLIALAIQRRSATSASVRELIDGLTRDIDDQLSAAFDGVLHDPAFAKLEYAWRSLQFLVTRLNFGEDIYLEYLNVSHDELLWDVTESSELKQTSLHLLLVGSTYATFGGWPYGLVCSLHPIAATRDGLTLATAFAEVAARAQTPFLVAAPPPDAWEGAKSRALERDWQSFRRTDAAAYVCLCPGNFRLRSPYDPARQGSSIRAFHYKENFADPAHGLPMATPALALAARIGESFARRRWYSEIRGVVRLDVPADTFELWATRTSEGASLTLQDCARLASLGYIVPLPEDSGCALNFTYINIFKPPPDGASPATDTDPARFQHTLDAKLVACRFAQLVILKYRENIGLWSGEGTEEISRMLEVFLRQFVSEIPDPSPSIVARKPLRKASVQVEKSGGNSPIHLFTLLLAPHVACGGAAFTVQISGPLH